MNRRALVCSHSLVQSLTLGKIKMDGALLNILQQAKEAVQCIHPLPFDTSTAGLRQHLKPTTSTMSTPPPLWCCRPPRCHPSPCYYPATSISTIDVWWSRHNAGQSFSRSEIHQIYQYCKDPFDPFNSKGFLSSFVQSLLYLPPVFTSEGACPSASKQLLLINILDNQNHVMLRMPNQLKSTCSWQEYVLSLFVPEKSFTGLQTPPC